MAFTIPNRPDTTDADQAEPDKGDFQTLGYQKSGVISGGGVTNTATNTVTAAAVSGYLNGEYFNITADTVLSMAAPATGNAKFVLINVQKSGGVFSVYALQGTTGNNGESASNARFPDFDSTTDMLLAAVYYASGDTGINAAAIVDKRVVLLPQANPTVVTSTPGSAVGAIGEIRIDSNMTPGQGETRVYVKTDATTWTLMGAPISGVSEEEVQDIVGAMFTTDATHSGVSAVYDDAGGGIDLTGASSWNITVAGSTEPIGDSDTVALNISSDAEVSLSHSNGTITINDEWPRIRTLTHPTLGSTKPAHYLVSDPWGYEWSFDLDQFIYSKLKVAHLEPMVDNDHHCGHPSYRWSSVHCAGVVYHGGLSGPSDRNLKMNFGTSPGVSFIKDLMPLSFSWKASPDKPQWGFVAQDVEEACTTNEIDKSIMVHTLAEDGYKYLDSVIMITPIVKALQEVITRVEALENG